MHKKFCSRNLMEPLQKHGLMYEDNRIYVKGIGHLGEQYFAVVKILVLNCCENCNEISGSENDLEIL